MRVATPLAYVRLTDGGTVSLTEGETVPDEADQEHVKVLVDKGVLVDGDVDEDRSGGSQGDPAVPAKKTVAKPTPPRDSAPS